MDNQDLILELMKAHKEESNRRFDQLGREISILNKKIESLTQWKWTTKGKLAGMIMVGGIVMSVVIDYCRSIFNK